LIPIVALVDEDDGLAERLAQLVLQRAAHDVGVPAGRKRHDHVDRPRRIALRGGRRCCCEQQAEGEKNAKAGHAAFLPNAC
jgi:hypothetical protein